MALSQPHLEAARRTWPLSMTLRTAMFACSIARVKEGKTQAMCRLGCYVVRCNTHALAAIVVLLTMIAAAAWAADGETPGVLILHSNQRPTPAAVVIEDTLRTKIPGVLQRPVELYSEYLDSEWSSIMAYGAEEAEFLQHKYG